MASHGRYGHTPPSPEPLDAVSTSPLFPNITDALNSSSRHSPHQNLEQYLLYDVAYYLNSSYLWVIFAFGFPGNIVSFITILRMKPLTSPTMYVAAVAFVDNTCLLCKVVFFMLTKFDVNIGSEGCAILSFLGSFVAQFANWLLVAMTIERCLAICLPLKVGSICTKKLHTCGLVLVIVALIGLNGHILVTTEMVDTGGGNLKCLPIKDFDRFLKMWFWVDAVIYAVLPALLLIILNSLIVMGIRRSAIVQRELTNKASQVAESLRQQRQITTMLVVVCIAYVVLITPLALFYAVMHRWSYEENSYEYVKYMFTNQVVFALADSTHAVNFYLYFFSTRRFRKRCLETFLYFCIPRRRARRFSDSANYGMSKSFRLSMTDVASEPKSAVRLANISSSSSSSFNQLLVGSGENKMSRLKSARDSSFQIG